MKSLIYKAIYQPGINQLIRPLSLLSSRILGKRLISVSGKITVRVSGIRFDLFTNQTSSVTQELYYHGAEKYEFTPLFLHLIKVQSVFIDVGANIGYFSILTSKVNPTCKVFAVEPSVGSLHYLKKNVAKNHSGNVKIIDKAISNINGQLEFYEVTNKKYPWIKYNLNGSNSLAKDSVVKSNQHYKVDVITLDALIKKHSLQTIDLIKLDTECTEHLILSDSIDVLKKYEPIIICEVYPIIEVEVEKILKTSLPAYSIYQYREQSNDLIPITSFKDISAEDSNRNFVFCPDKKRSRIEGFLMLN